MGEYKNMKPQGRDLVSRRQFVKATGTVYIAAVAGCAGSAKQGSRLILTDVKADLPVCQGYIVVDKKKCQGCVTCMLACSLAHHGRENLSLSRIQILQDSFERWPEDLDMEQCRQCVEPECVKNCPTGALHVDTNNGNIRTVNRDECIGCMTCVNSCPFPPARAIWNHEDGHAQKCDLCADTPFWNEKGGPAGKQACVEMCPLKAIAFQKEVPVQKGDAGYEVNLRGEAWEKLGFPTD